MRNRGEHLGLLAGVPFAAKSLFDIEGHTTVAGTPARADFAPARNDAFLVAQLKRQGAILVGTTHMDELACGATGENPHSAQ
jgi:aspartyl-tRNA(Asn)/glutamyl-tRNA(Gln) amidotransferase subunit A